MVIKGNSALHAAIGLLILLMLLNSENWAENWNLRSADNLVHRLQYNLAVVQRVAQESIKRPPAVACKRL